MLRRGNRRHRPASSGLVRSVDGPRLASGGRPEGRSVSRSGSRPSRRPANRIDVLSSLRILDALGSGRLGRGPGPWTRELPLRLVRGRFGLSPIEAAAAARSAERPSASTARRDRTARFADYLRIWNSRADELRALLGRLSRQGPSLAERSFELARPYLPRGTALPSHSLVFLPMGFDARVDRGTVYFDPVLALDSEPRRIRRLLAHELHHVARFGMTGENLSSITPGPTRWARTRRGIAQRWFAYLEMEGIADRVGRITDLHLPALAPVAAERTHQARTWASLAARTEAAILAVGERPAASSRTAADALAMIGPGIHPLGEHLAESIERGLGRAALADCVGHPERFFERFQIVARRGPSFRFRPELFG